MWKGTPLHTVHIRRKSFCPPFAKKNFLNPCNPLPVLDFSHVRQSCSTANLGEPMALGRVISENDAEIEAGSLQCGNLDTPQC